MMDLMVFRENLYRFILCLSSSISNVSLYPLHHPYIDASIKETYAELLEILKGRAEIRFVLLKNVLISNGIPLMFKSASWNDFLDMLRKKEIGQITFCAGLPFDQLEQFIINFTSDRKDQVFSTKFIKLAKIDLKDDSKEAEFIDPGADELDGVLDLGMLEPNRMVKDFFQNIMLDGTFHMDNISEVVTFFLEQVRKGGSSLTMLASLKSFDEYTFTHAVNVCILTMSLAESLGFSGSHLRDIGTAAVLHDIGKTLISEEILLKKGPLDSDERAVMENHPLQGARQLMKVKGLPKLALTVALEHHIKYDGTGYPHVKGPWQTNIVSQMISIADVFDALRTKRPYREAVPPDEVERILRLGSGVSFNPFLLERFLEGIKNTSPS
jgi:putative nucleotidyltransferase with HDIG domain